MGNVHGPRPARKVIPKMQALYREDNDEVLAILSNKYVPFQNAEAFAFMDSLAQDRLITYERAGSTHGGRFVYIVTKMPEDINVVGDNFHPYTVLTMRHDGRGGIGFFSLMERLICTNQLRGSPRMRVVHNARLYSNLERAREVLRVTTKEHEKMTWFLAKAAEYKVSQKDVLNVQTALFGTLDDDTPARRRHAIEAFQAIYAAEAAMRGDNAYSLVNAVTGYADHELSYQGDSETRAQARLLSTVGDNGVGMRLKQTGLAVVEELIGVGAG
jgi:phage/plasmid-like protein (TIGR03299 family)